MRRALGWAAPALCLLSLLLPSGALGQAASHRPVRRGDVTGVELGLEGSLTATRGEPLRWLLSVHEVVGLRELRPAAGAHVAVFASYATGGAVAEVDADADGRATIELAVPEDAPQSFRAVLEVRAPVGASRRFELDVLVRPRHTLQLVGAREVMPPGSTFRVAGRLSRTLTGAGAPRAEITLTMRDELGRPLGAPAVVRTDAAGAFAEALRVPRSVRGAVTVEARHEETEEVHLTATAYAHLQEASASALLVGVAPERSVLDSREPVQVDVVVRTASGRPVEGAVLTVPVERREDRTRVVTDARGRARFTYRAPHVGEGHADRPIQVVARREGVGQGAGQAVVRVSAVDHAVALAVEGGAIPEAIGGRLYARVTGIDGRPAAAGLAVSASGPRLPAAGVTGTTDPQGVAVLDLALVAPRESDRCGGERATALEVRVGTGNRATRRSVCMPVDPDAAARVRVDPVIARAGAHVRVDIARAPAAARLPVAVALLVHEGASLRAVSSHVLRAGETTTEVAIPADAVGRVLVRARPLLGTSREEVRGGSAAILVTAGERARTVVRFDPAAGAALVGFAGGSADRSSWAVALPVAEARALEQRLRAGLGQELGDLRVELADALPNLVAATLASTLPQDLGAPFVLRGRDAVPVPAPTDPVREGLLRDPFRARSRFVEGRLALLLRAIEDHVEASVPEHLEHVGLEVGGRWRFNDQILASVAASGRLGDAGATGLGGEPLTVTQLTTLDPAFTYDAVARRITRKRLFRLILALRALASQNHLDLRWAWRGEPSTWIRQLVGRHVPEVGSLAPRELVDAWGRPFELRPAAGGRPRFDRVAPIGGWEIVSAGPDGRFGTGDDLWDPTARVLPARGLYAEAVGEDALVARLGGVELGRATVEMAADVFSTPRPSVPEAHEQSAGLQAASLFELPSLFEPDVHALALHRPTRAGDGAGGALVTLPVVGGSMPLALDEEPRTWGVVALSVTPEGAASIAFASARGGAPLLVEGEVPRRVRVGERVGFELLVTNVTQEPLAVRAQPAAAAMGLEAPEGFELPPGEARAVALSLTATAPGPHRVDLELLGADGRTLRRIGRQVAVDRGLHPMRRRAAAVVRDGAMEVQLEIPRDAQGAGGRVVLLAPAALAADPDLAELRHADPALLAWASALSGRLDPELLARLLRAQGPGGEVAGAEPALSTACAVVALSAASADDEELASARERAVSALGQESVIGGGEDEAGALRADAARLAALAVAGVPVAHDDLEEIYDPVGQVVAQSLPRLRAALRAYPAEPTLLARAAGALLVADPRDGHGLAMLERVASGLADEDAVLVRGSEARASQAESLTATLALAVAAHQAGEALLAGRLLRGAATLDQAIGRLGGEAVFWRLAVGAYGVMGVGEPTTVRVRADGETREVRLEAGLAIVALEDLTPGASRTIRVEADGETALHARVEAVFGVPFRGSDAGPFALELQGDVGREGGVAALELSVQARVRVDHPVVDLQLPAGVRADAQLLATIASASAVARAERRDPGFLRVHLGPLAAEQRATVPLPLVFRTHGEIRGLAAVAYDAAAPSVMTTVEPRALSVARAQR